jgi:phage replication O-like protein O
MKPVAPPTYTQIPNEFLDCINEFTPAEFKVLMALCRETFGWHRKDATISLGQLEKMTGLSRTAVSNALTNLDEERQLLKRTKIGGIGKETVSYRLRISDDPTSSVSGLVVSDYRSTETTSRKNGLVVSVDETSSLSGPPLVVSDYPPPLKKDLKKLKEKQQAAASSPSAQNGSMDQGRSGRNGHGPSAQNVSPAAAAAAAAAVFGAIISPTDALRLVETHPGCIDHAEALVREASKPKINDPAGMLVHLVMTGWVPPPVTSNGHGPADEEDMTGYLGGYCPTCAAITFGSCGHEEQQPAARPRRRGRQPA